MNSLSRIIISLVLAFVVYPKLGLADVKLPALVSDNMVLQRDTKISLWGWADPGEEISIQFLDQQILTKADQKGKWQTALAPIAAGGPFEMVITGKNTITIKNILIGDVWLASGQSNMEFITRNVLNSKEELSEAEYPNIRLLQIKHQVGFQPQKDVISDGWKPCTSDEVRRFSAVAYFFGRELYKKYQVPIGLINASWGGTIVEAWMGADGFNSFEDLKNDVVSIQNLSREKFEEHEAKRNAWLKSNGSFDRGTLASGKQWAAVDLDTSDWATIEMPAFWTDRKEMKGYSGIAWLRKSFELPSEYAGKPVELHLGTLINVDSTYLNGKLVGSGRRQDNTRVYNVPEEIAKKGRNVLTIRLEGLPNLKSGIEGLAEDIYAKAGEFIVPLAGSWKINTGPDISDFPAKIKGLEKFNTFSPNAATLLFNGMISPLIPISLKGVIWYQGESNADTMEDALKYNELFPALISNWRKQWGYNFPFVFVQLANYKADRRNPADYAWAHLREAQSNALRLPNTGMAVTIDIGDVTNIHPKNKQEVGCRLALAAQKVAYHENVVFSGPTFKELKVEGNKIRLSFGHLGSGLLVKDKYGYIKGFAISGADKQFKWAIALQDGNDVVVYNPSISKPLAVRYNWGNSPEGNLYNLENLPTVPFRTDNW